jgi:uncharacterized protein
MRILAFSDLHRDLALADGLVERAQSVDAVVCVGDVASFHEGLAETVASLAAIQCPAVVVPGNHETPKQLETALKAWPAAKMLHGTSTRIDGVNFFGLGGGIPPTPFDWSFDLTEQQASNLLAQCPVEAVLCAHSPPYGYLDLANNRHLGSGAILEAIQTSRPQTVVCGHIHECWGKQAAIGSTPVLNLGPHGVVIEV